MAAIAADRIVRHLEHSGFVVLKEPPAVGAAAVARGLLVAGRCMKAVQD